MTNRELASHLRDLYAYLAIAGYDELHARRFLHIASDVDTMGEEVESLKREGRLQEIPGVGPSTSATIKQILETGTCSKREEWEHLVPYSAIELLQVPGLGVRTAQRLWHEFGIHSLESLLVAIDAGKLDGATGIGAKTKARWRDAAVRRLRSAEAAERPT